MTEYWVQTALAPMADVAAQAARLESDGWAGVMVFDSQCLIGDPYVVLALAAAATRRLGLGVGVTNPVTRHAAVAAAAIASVQAASAGRATLGIGRGNSSLAYLGAGPPPLAEFEDYVRLLQTYLSGEAAPVRELLARRDGLAPLDPASLGKAPEESRLQWLDPALPKVPVEIAATGPRMTAIGARRGDRVSFSVGADEDRLSAAIAAVRAEAEAAGRAPPPLTAYVSVAVLPDRARARRLAAPDVAMHAHLAAVSPAAVAALPEGERRVAERLAQTYDMTRHGRHGAQTEALDDAFIDAHAIAGPATECAERLGRLAGLGLGRLVLMVAPPLKGEARESYEGLVQNVLPALGGAR